MTDMTRADPMTTMTLTAIMEWVAYMRGRPGERRPDGPGDLDDALELIESMVDARVAAALRRSPTIHPLAMAVLDGVKAGYRANSYSQTANAAHREGRAWAAEGYPLHAEGPPIPGTDAEALAVVIDAGLEARPDLAHAVARALEEQKVVPATYPEASPHPRCERPNCEEHEFPGSFVCSMCSRLRTEDRKRVERTEDDNRERKP